MKKIKYKIYTLGCKVNQSDSYFLSRKLSALNFVKTDGGADLAIVNSCAVTRSAIRKSGQIINRARNENPTAKIALIGCWPKVYQKQAKNLHVDLVYFDKELSSFAKELSSLFASTYSGVAKKTKVQLKFNPKKSRYFLKIQDGCNQFCSYCIIPYARGKLKSQSVGDVSDEVGQAVGAGYGEIVLCGIHLGLYGADLPDRINLVELLKKIVKTKNLGRIRLSSIEATEVSDELIALIASSRKICRHLHIPLQSGSNKILKLMNRPYSVKYFENKIQKIRQIMPDISLTTDVIVGFPGEDEKDFNDTCLFIKKMKFSRLHVFPFSAHEKTPAAKMSGQVNKKDIQSRANELRIISKKMEHDYKEKFAGSTLNVVVEYQDEESLKGKTEYYFNVEKKLKTKTNLAGKITKVIF